MTQLDNVSKQALRLAAVGALLHNLGKIHGKFLDKQINSGSNDYLYQHILGLIAPHVGNLYADWQADYSGSKLSTSAILDMKTVNALAHTFSLPEPLNDRTDYTSGDLIEYLGQGEPWYSNETGKFGIECLFSGGSRLTHLMNRAHRGASGGEKEDIATAQQPDPSDLYLSTPFGYETAAPNINTINNLLQQIETAIQRYLLSPTDPLLLADLISDLRPLLSQAIADTQRPLNDVTIGDIGHTGMAFLLTQATEWILTRRAIDHDKLAKKEADNTLFWRVLTIHTDSLRYIEEASSLADLRVRQQQLQDAFQKVSQQLEDALLAVEIYTDEQRRLFVFPNLDANSPVDQSSLQSIQNVLNTDGLRLSVQLSEPVTNHPKDQNGAYIGNEILKQLKTDPPYDFDADTIFAAWHTPNEQGQTPICTVCNLRPQGYGAKQIMTYADKPSYYRKKAEDRRICCICMDRRYGAAKQWTTGKADHTIWLDEVADSNGRLALIVGHWDIITFNQTVTYPHKSHYKEQNQTFWRVRFLDQPPPDGYALHNNQLIWDEQRHVFQTDVKLNHNNKLTQMQVTNPSSVTLQVSNAIRNGTGEWRVVIRENLLSLFGMNQVISWQGKQYQVVGQDTLAPLDITATEHFLSHFYWDTVHPFTVESVNAIKYIRANSKGSGANYPSFARLRRVWQTTKTFWQEAQRDIDKQLSDARRRLLIKPANQPDLAQYQVYELDLFGATRMSVLWDGNRLISTDNLSYTAVQLGIKREERKTPADAALAVGAWLDENKQKRFQLISDDEKNRQFNIQIIDVDYQDAAYATTIPILAEPRTFMALVPADKALGVIDAIKTKYEREMGKVRNRLPLHLGAVYFHRRTPLRAALDAGRRMLQQKPLGGDQPWYVKPVTHPAKADLPPRLDEGTQHFDQTIRLELTQGERTVTWHVPNVMGDGLTPDNWYPYVFFQQDSAGNGEPTGRLRIFKGLRPKSDGSTVECWLVHANELQQGDQVYFTPATFDFEWLDSSAQRFTIAYDPQTGQRRANPAWPTPTRPYLLDDLVTIQKVWQMISEEHGLTSSQIYALRDLVEAKREEWRPTPEECKRDGMFWRFCNDAMTNANWGQRPPKEKLQALTDWIVSGLFTDVVQLQMGIMKHKPQREEQNHE